MLRALIKTGPLLAIPLPWFPSNKYDVTAAEKANEVQLNTAEIGLDRLKKIFRLEEEGYFSKELRSLFMTTSTAGFIGFFLGGLLRTADFKERFIEEHRATKFANHFEAKRQMQYKLFIDFVKGGKKLGIKLGLFCFILGSTLIGTTTYRGKVELASFVSSGAVTGCLFKMNMGLKGMAAGSLVGSALGFVGGTATMLVLYLTGHTIEDIYATQARWIEIRQERIRENAKKYMEENQPELVKLHNQAMMEEEKEKSKTNERIPETASDIKAIK